MLCLSRKCGLIEFAGDLRAAANTTVVFHTHLAAESWVASECTARSLFTNTAEKQGLFSEAVILSPAPHKPEQLCNSGAEIKLQKLQHMGSKSGENLIFQKQEYTGTEFCNKAAPAVFK